MDRLNTKEKVVGLKQSRRAVMSGRAKLVYIARDADMHVIFPFERICEEKGVEIVYVNNMKELAKACHVEVKTATAVLLND